MIMIVNQIKKWTKAYKLNQHLKHDIAGERNNICFQDRDG